MAPTDGGTEASKRMHEYLVSKQRKQEEYWLRKYGKVVQAAPPSVGKPSGNPRLPAIGTINSGINSGAPSNRTSNNGLPSAEPSGALLPPIAGVQQAHGGAAPAGMLPPHHIRQQQPRGQAPIFQAKEPVRDFFQRNAPRAGRGGGGGPAARDEYGNIIPPSRRPPEPLRRAQNQQPLPRQLPPLAAASRHRRRRGAPAPLPLRLPRPGCGGPVHHRQRLRAHRVQLAAVTPQPTLAGTGAGGGGGCGGGQWRWRRRRGRGRSTSTSRQAVKAQGGAYVWRLGASWTFQPFRAAKQRNQLCLHTRGCLHTAAGACAVVRPL